MTVIIANGFLGNPTPKQIAYVEDTFKNATPSMAAIELVVRGATLLKEDDKEIVLETVFTDGVIKHTIDKVNNTVTFE